jgi:hypothetical protein
VDVVAKSHRLERGLWVGQGGRQPLTVLLEPLIELLTQRAAE